MIVLALALLIIVLVFSVAIVLSNPDVYQLSLFRVLVPVTSAGVFFTGFGAALVTITALLLLRAGIRRSRETRRRLKKAEQPAVGSTAGPNEDRSDTGRSADPDSGGDDPEPADRSGSSSLDLDSDEDRPTVPTDPRTAGSGVDDRDEPRI
jgi:membrane protein implicated in regulation of membrane protease activity